MLDLLYPALGLALFGFAAIFMMTYLRRRRQQVSAESYSVAFDSRGTIMSAAEARVFRFLFMSLHGKAHVCPKVRVADIVAVRQSSSSKESQSSGARTGQKHIDFLITDFDGRALFGVEVDDRSMDPAQRTRRDKSVQKAFESAGIPMIRVMPSDFDQDRELQRAIDRISAIEKVPEF